MNSSGERDSHLIVYKPEGKTVLTLCKMGSGTAVTEETHPNTYVNTNNDPHA